MKRIIMPILLCFVFALPVSATETDDIYSDLYNASGINELESNLNSDVGEVLDRLGLDVSDYSSFVFEDSSSYVEVVVEFLKKGIKKPLAALAFGFGVILLCSAFGGLWSQKLQMGENYNYICALSLAAVVLTPLMNTVTASIDAVKAVGSFMLSFVPIYGGLIIANGGITSGVVYQSVMLIFCEGLSSGLGYFIAPVISIYICIGITSAVSGIEGAYLLALRIKSVANWLLGLVMTLFSGFLSIQSIVTKAADTVSIKTARFFVGSFVPVVGGALGEALTTVTAGVGLLRATATAWCMVILAIMLLPVIIELLVWRVVMFILSAVSITLNIPDSAKLFDTLSAAIGFLIAVILMVGIMFILSLVILKAGV